MLRNTLLYVHNYVDIKMFKSEQCCSKTNKIQTVFSINKEYYGVHDKIKKSFLRSFIQDHLDKFSNINQFYMRFGTLIVCLIFE